MALTSQPALGFTIGGPGHKFWSPNPAPNPLPNINGIGSGFYGGDIATIVGNGTFATVTTTTALPADVVSGDSVTISNSTFANGIYSITVTGSNTFQIGNTTLTSDLTGNASWADNNPPIDTGFITVITAGSGPTLTNTISFAGGKLATQPIVPLVVNPLNGAVVFQSVQSVTLNSGAGYKAPIVKFTDPTGTGTGATGTVIGTLTGVTITDPGSGYTSKPTVTFRDPLGTGSGAAGVAEISGGQLVSITITKGGSGYTIAPDILLSGGGFTTPATVVGTLSVTGINMLTPGTGYSYPVDIAITDAEGDTQTTTTGPSPSFTQPAVGSTVTFSVGDNT